MSSKTAKSGVHPNVITTSQICARKYQYCCEFPAQCDGKIANVAVLFKIYARDFRMIDSCELPSTVMIGPSD